MKHFTFRLFLIKRLLDSLINENIDGHEEYSDNLVEAVAYLHSEIEEMNKSRHDAEHGIKE